MKHKVCVCVWLYTEWQENLSSFNIQNYIGKSFCTASNVRENSLERDKSEKRYARRIIGPDVRDFFLFWILWDMP